MNRAGRLLAVTLALMPSIPGGPRHAASITPSPPLVTLHVALAPEQLGHGTTIDFAVHIADTDGSVPPPVTAISFLYPAHLGIATSGLGLADCTLPTLERAGPQGCPSKSLMGFGTALADVDIGGELVQEQAFATAFMAPFQNGGISLLFAVEGYNPLSASLLLSGEIVPAQRPFGGALEIKVPLLEGVPDGPDVALAYLHSTIGPLGIRYYNHVHGRYVPYTPTGITLPQHCPRHGFRFLAIFTFATGITKSAHATVRCPGEH